MLERIRRIDDFSIRIHVNFDICFYFDFDNHRHRQDKTSFFTTFISFVH